MTTWIPDGINSMDDVIRALDKITDDLSDEAEAVGRKAINAWFGAGNLFRQASLLDNEVSLLCECLIYLKRTRQSGSKT